MVKDDECQRHKTATQRKNEAKKVILDKCCRDLAASVKKMVAESHMEKSQKW